jgi:hypothetical protein
MLTIAQTLWLFAVRRQAMGGGFRGENNTFDLTPILTVLGVLIPIIAALFLIDRWIRRRIRQRTYDSPSGLFQQLCQTHELDRSGRRLMHLLASHWQLTNPGVLFIEPDYFRPDKLPPDWYDHAPELEQLHRQLFEAP